MTVGGDFMLETPVYLRGLVMKAKVYCIFEEKFKREENRKLLVMKTKDLKDYLRFRETLRRNRAAKRKRTVCG